MPRPQRHYSKRFLNELLTGAVEHPPRATLSPLRRHGLREMTARLLDSIKFDAIFRRIAAARFA
jgi:hypothetical protein